MTRKIPSINEITEEIGDIKARIEIVEYDLAQIDRSITSLLKIELKEFDEMIEQNVHAADENLRKARKLLKLMKEDLMDEYWKTKELLFELEGTVEKKESL